MTLVLTEVGKLVLTEVGNGQCITYLPNIYAKSVVSNVFYWSESLVSLTFLSLVQSGTIEPNNLAFHTTVNSLKLIVRFAIYGSICKIEPAKRDNTSVKYFIIPPPFSPSGGGHGGGRPLRLCGYLLWTPLPACREIAAHIPHTSQNILGQNPAIPDLTQSDF